MVREKIDFSSVVRCIAERCYYEDFDIDDNKNTSRPSLFSLECLEKRLCSHSKKIYEDCFVIGEEESGRVEYIDAFEFIVLETMGSWTDKSLSPCTHAYWKLTGYDYSWYLCNLMDSHFLYNQNLFVFAKFDGVYKEIPFIWSVIDRKGRSVDVSLNKWLELHKNKDDYVFSLEIGGVCSIKNEDEAVNFPCHSIPELYSKLSEFAYRLGDMSCFVATYLEEDYWVGVRHVERGQIITLFKTNGEVWNPQKLCFETNPMEAEYFQRVNDHLLGDDVDEE